MELNQVEKVICDYFNIEKDVVLSKSRKQNITMARGFLILFVHDFANMSHKKMSRRYDYSMRNIQYIYSNTKHLSKIDKEFIGHYENIFDLINDLK